MVSERDNGLVSISGDASDTVTISVEEDRAIARSNGIIKNASAYSYVGVGKETLYQNISANEIVAIAGDTADAETSVASEIENSTKDEPSSTEHSEHSQNMKKVMVFSSITAFVLILLIALLVVVIRKRATRKQD